MSAKCPDTRLASALTTPKLTMKDMTMVVEAMWNSSAPISGTTVRSSPTMPPTKALTSTSSENCRQFSRSPRRSPCSTETVMVGLSTRGRVLPRLAPREHVTVDLEAAGVLLARCSLEGVRRRAERHVDEPRLAQHLLPGCTRQTTGDSSGPEIDVVDGRLGNWAAVGDVGELQPATGPQHAEDLGEHRALIGTEVDHAVADHDVGPAVVHRQPLGQAFAELDIAHAHRLCRRPRLGEHLFRHVDADHLAGRADLAGSDQGVEAGTRSDIDDLLAALQ